MKQTVTFDIQAAERVFLFTFIALRFLVFARSFGQYLGYDVRGHLQVVSAISWSSPFLSPHSLYYAYHPPLGFLLTHTLAMTGMSPLLAAQILSFLASLGAFFFMRLTLKALGLLDRIPGIVFLYLGASIPMQIYLSVTVSLDVFVLCCMSMALFFSVQIFCRQQTLFYVFLYGAALAIMLTVASFFKLNGLFLLPIPFIVFLFSGSAFTLKRFFLVIGTTFTPFFLVLLYLYYRNYLPEGTFFFSTAGMFLWADIFRRAVEWRDSHLFLFILSSILPIKDGMPRLMPTWNSLWFMVGMGFTSLFTAFFAILYNSIAPVQ